VSPCIRAYVRPADRGYEPYQLYYREGLRLHSESLAGSYEEISMTRFARPLGMLRRLRSRRTVDALLRRIPPARHAVESIVEAVEGTVKTPSGHFHDGVGQYLISSSGREARICIDSTDYPELPYPDLLPWCDVYFKANKWLAVDYPEKVVPIVNGDPFILERVPRLREMRAAEKDYDLCFIVRVWGGRTGVEGVEHNLRLIEALADAPCRKFLLAYLAIGDRKRYARRLRARGIASTTRGLRPDEIWRLTSRSRLSVIRLGMHHCIPWRMAGSLALGSCILLDREPLSQWPEPLRPDTNFLSLGVDTGPDAPVAPADAYNRVPDLIAGWLQHEELLATIRGNNAKYFDWHVAPGRVGRYILDQSGSVPLNA
jgi:hypothetical protein